jgi:cystathionine gamma-synthase
MGRRFLELGADLVMHSTTKYLNGHSDVVGGAVISATQADYEQLKWWANCCGVTGAPFDSWLTLRGLRTLSVRLAQQQASAAHVVERLLAHPAVEAVHYPGLANHPGHAIARKQQTGFARC